jgi:hypothetical protein
MATIISTSVKPRGLPVWRERARPDAQNPFFMLYRPPPHIEVAWGGRFSLIAIAGDSIFSNCHWRPIERQAVEINGSTAHRLQLNLN